MSLALLALSFACVIRRQTSLAMRDGWFLCEHTHIMENGQIKTSAQRYRGTEAQRHRGTEAQRHRGTEAQRYRGTEIQRYRGTFTHRCVGTQARWQTGKLVPGCTGPYTGDVYTGTRSHAYAAHGYTGSQVRSTDTYTPTHVPASRCTRVHHANVASTDRLPQITMYRGMRSRS
jgi:hypothetical protein